MRHAFSYGYNDTAALSPWEGYILYRFRHTAIGQLLCLRRVETEKLAQAGFGDFLADAHVSRLKGKCDDNNEVYWLIQFVTVPDTNRLTVNSKVQELK
jgi:hypothetical protein